MKQTTLPFQIAIGPRTTGHTYPVRATFDGAETHADLALPDYMLDYAVRLPRPGVTLPLGDPGLLGRTLGRALFAPPLRELVLQSAKTVARGGGRLQLQLQIGPPELAALPWELVTVGLNKPWSPA
ncbi:MAG TPA: polysaccharide deacetylase, partial [Roseiflexaceae bacterium]